MFHKHILLTFYFYLLLNWKSPKLAYEVVRIKSLPNIKILDLANLKDFADDKGNVN